MGDFALNVEALRNSRGCVGILFVGVHGHAVFAGSVGVDKLDHDVGPHTFDEVVEPLLERNTGSRVPRRMAFLLVGRTVGDVDPAAIGLPAGDGGREMVVGIRDAPVVFLFEFVFRRAGSGIAAQPELFDEVLALRVGLQAFECRALFVGDDVGDVLGEPLVVGVAVSTGAGACCTCASSGTGGAGGRRRRSGLPRRHGCRQADGQNCGGKDGSQSGARPLGLNQQIGEHVSRGYLLWQPARLRAPPHGFVPMRSGPRRRQAHRPA